MTALAATTASYDPARMHSTDRIIRLSTAIAVLTVAGIAAYVSYWHAYAVVQAHGETGISARLEPATIDGLVYASSMVLLHAARHGLRVPPLARWLLGLGIAATLTANMAHGWTHGSVGAAVAAWPAVSLVGSYELLIWLIRTGGQAERDRRCEAQADLCSDGSVTLVASPTPDGQSAPVPVSGPDGLADSRTSELQRELHVGTVDDQAVAAYQLSVRAGNPLSERKLAARFERTSRRWARARMAEARQRPDLALAGVPSTARLPR